MTERDAVLGLILILLVPVWLLGLYLLCTQGHPVPPPLPPLGKDDDRI